MVQQDRQGSSFNRRRRRASSDMSESDEEDDRMEMLLSHHQQRNVSDWGQGDGPSENREGRSRSARRDSRRDMQRKRRRDEIGGGGSRQSFNPDESFEVDNVGVVVRNLVGSNVDQSANSPVVKESKGLLLPGHVAILTEGERVEAEATLKNNSGKEAREEDKEDELAQGDLGDFIRLDTDRSGQAARYYEAEEEEQRKALEECLTCGEKGHDKKSCPHLQCLACGILDEHSTRDCPMGMSCFRCGGLGHKAFECKKPRTHGSQGWKECQRCGLTSHVETNCPTLWRIYCYKSVNSFNEDRLERYKEGGDDQRRERSRRFVYRSESESEQEEGEARSAAYPPNNWDPIVRWCYNCAAQGNHWGDDCPLPRCNPTRGNGDPSAFSEYLSRGGPFAYNLPPPPIPDQDAYRSGLRRGGDYDRFEAGPRASMHVYDPQREAMHSVDQLFDRYGPEASRRRVAARRRGDRPSPPREPSLLKRIDRKSGQGSKAERYREMEEERERSQSGYNRWNGRSSQVSNVASGPALLKRKSSTEIPSEESSDVEIVQFIPAREKREGGIEVSTSSKKVGNDSNTNLTKKQKQVATTGEQPKQESKKERKSRQQRARKQEAKLRKAAKKARKDEMEKAVAQKQVLKAAKKAVHEAEQVELQARKQADKLAKREELKKSFLEAQARRLTKGKHDEYERKAKRWAEQEANWRAEI